MSSKKFLDRTGPVWWALDRMQQTMTLLSQMAEVHPVTKLLERWMVLEQILPTRITLGAMWMLTIILSSFLGKC